MEMALGMSELTANLTGWRGAGQGTQMKTTYGWSGDGNGTNSSGFSGLPGGERTNNGAGYTATSIGYWWSSSPNGSSAWYRALTRDFETVFRDADQFNWGYSVRCIKD